MTNKDRSHILTSGGVTMAVCAQMIEGALNEAEARGQRRAEALCSDHKFRLGRAFMVCRELMAEDAYKLFVEEMDKHSPLGTQQGVNSGNKT